MWSLSTAAISGKSQKSNSVFQIQISGTRRPPSTASFWLGQWSGSWWFPKQQRDRWQVIGDKASLGGSLQNLPLTVMELQLWLPGQVLSSAYLSSKQVWMIKFQTGSFCIHSPACGPLAFGIHQHPYHKSFDSLSDFLCYLSSIWGLDICIKFIFLVSVLLLSLNCFAHPSNPHISFLYSPWVHLVLPIWTHV